MKVRIGFIGCGGNGNGHLRRLHQMPDVDIAGVCDIVPQRAERAASDYGSKPYYDHRRLLEAEDLDAVFISIPVDAHGEVERNVCAKGLPFFVEKPVARQMETAKEVEKAVQEAGVITCVGYQLRYLPSVSTTRSFLQGRTVSLVDGHYWCGSGRADRWNVVFARAGGQLVEQATHTIDLMRYIVGEIEEVCCYQANRVLGEIDSPDTYTVNFRFANGALGSLTTLWHLDPSDWSEANVVSLFCDNHRLTVRGNSVEIRPEDVELPQPTEEKVIDRVFIDAVKSGDSSEILSSYSDAVRSLAISLAANESARLGGQPVSPESVT